MSIKLALLKSGETVISDTKELLSENKVCGFLLKNPHLVIVSNNSVLLVEESQSEINPSVEVSLTKWIFLAKDTEIPIPPDWVVAILEPLDSLKQMYEEKVNGSSNKVSFTEE